MQQTAGAPGSSLDAEWDQTPRPIHTLTQSPAPEYGPKGIHVVYVILDGILTTETSRSRRGLDESRMMKLDQVADAYLHLASQPRSAWTFELDFRPMGEAF